MSFFLRKLLRAAFSILFVFTGIFLLMRMAGDPALAILGPDDFPPAVLEGFRASYGLDNPLHAQFSTYVGNVLSGDFGSSFLDQRPALNIVMERLPATLALMGVSLVIALVLGVPAGVLAAIRRDRPVDVAFSGAAIVFQATPNFVLGIALLLVFSVWLRVLPAAGAETWAHLALPAITFGASNAAIYARFCRGALLDVLGQPYIAAARARGLSNRVVLWRHALPCAALPLLTVLGFSIGGMIAGSIIVETIFAWPGIGRLTANAVAFRDLAVIQVIAVFSMTAMVMTNLAVDMLYGVLDPRVRVRGRVR